MSFLSDLAGWFTGSSTGAALARSALLGFLSNRLDRSISRDQEPEEPDYGVRETVDPNTEYSIPVIYGQAFTGGSVTDAVLSSDKQTMWYCMTVCEATGYIMSTQTQANPTGILSNVKFEETYWNGLRLRLSGSPAEGYTVSSALSADGDTVDSLNGLVKFYYYRRGSELAAAVGSSATPTEAETVPAWEVFPNWTENHKMSDLAFVLIRVQYNREKGVTGLGNIRFKVFNSIVQAGDVLYDYMTNTRYGAGLTEEEIFTR